MQVSPVRTDEFVMIVTTVDNLESAQSIAGNLIKRKAAACVQVEGPVESFYQWKGSLEKSEEYRIVAKTTVSQQSFVYTLILKSHPYEVPQILTLPIVSGFESYLAWIKKETGEAEK